MVENMTGAVGHAIHEDRQARALKNARIAEAVTTRKAARIGTEGWTWRQILRGR